MDVAWLPCAPSRPRLLAWLAGGGRELQQSGALGAVGTVQSLPSGTGPRMPACAQPGNTKEILKNPTLRETKVDHRLTTFLKIELQAN